MKRKGFTLVELLAVIVILAVIAIITVPMIGNVIEDSRKKALEQSVRGLVETANYFTMKNDGVYEFLFDENANGITSDGRYSLDYTGSIEAEGKLYIDNDKNISLCLMNENYYVYKNYNSGIYIGETKDDTCVVGYDALTNKYVAMLDDGTGSVGNVYSREQVDELIDGLQGQIDINSTSISSLTSVVNENRAEIESLKNNSTDSSNTVYNSETDSLDVYVDGEVIGSIFCGFQAYDILGRIIDSGMGYTYDQSCFQAKSYPNGSYYDIIGNSSCSGYATVYLYTNNFYDLTNYNKLVIKISAFNIPGGGSITFGYSDTPTGAVTTLATITGNSELEIDISNITGSKYLRFSCWLGTNSMFRIEKLELRNN